MNEWKQWNNEINKEIHNERHNERNKDITLERHTDIKTMKYIKNERHT